MIKGDEMKEVIKKLAESISAETQQNNEVAITAAVKYLKDNGWDNPEATSTMLCFEMAQFQDAVVNNLLGEGKHDNRLVFCYTNYNFLARHIEELAILKNGTSACSADISRYIISKYVEYLKTREIPDMKLDEDNYWIPKFGTNAQWIEFCNGLYKFYWGQPDIYVNAYNALMESEMRYYKHELQTLYGTFKDGESFVIAKAYDEEPTLIEEDGFYIILKGKCPREYPAAKSKFEFLPMVKIPKTDITLKITKEEIFI